MHRKIRWAPSRVHTKHISFSVPDLHSSSLAILQWRFCEGNLAPQWKPHQEHGWLLFLKGKKEDNQVWSHFYGVDLQVEEKVQCYSKYLNASNSWLTGKNSLLNNNQGMVGALCFSVFSRCGKKKFKTTLAHIYLSHVH